MSSSFFILPDNFSSEKLYQHRKSDYSFFLSHRLTIKKEHIIDFQPFFKFPTEFSPFTLTSFVYCKSTRFTTYILANFFWKPTIFSDYIHYTCEIFFLLGFKFKWSLGSLLQHHHRHYQQAAKPNNLFTHILLPFYLMCCFVTDNSHSPYLILWLCSRVEKRYVKRRCPFCAQNYVEHKISLFFEVRAFPNKNVNDFMRHWFSTKLR